MPEDLPTIPWFLEPLSARRRQLCSMLLLVQTLAIAPHALAKEIRPLRPGAWEHVKGDSTCAPTFKLVLRPDAALLTDTVMCGKGRTVSAKASYKIVREYKDRLLLALNFSNIRSGHNVGKMRPRRKTVLGPYKNKVLIRKGIWLKVTMKAVCRDKKASRELCFESKDGDRCMILVASERLTRTARGYKGLRPTCAEDSLFVPGRLQ